MPELPEVQTTVQGLDAVIRGLHITQIWTDYKSPHYIGTESIKDPAYFAFFKKHVIGTKVTHVTRRAKNILIHLDSGDTILIHMKMTGHLMYGDYNRADPFNRFIHLIFTFSNSQTLELCDMRKFAKVVLIEKSKISNAAGNHLASSPHLVDLGPEPLDPGFTSAIFKEQLMTKPNGKIKTVLMDQSVVAGIGNIYSDEALWRTGIHPERRVNDITGAEFTKLFSDVRHVLEKGIDFGGDSMSDYRNIDGNPGTFQGEHRAYRKTGTLCGKRLSTGVTCKGNISRKVVGGRSAHFCDTHQK